jgi:pilus assembly protein Flp/PilA
MLEMLQIYLFQLINRFRKDEEGASLVEYGMLVGLIAVVCIAAVTLLGTTINGVFGAINTALTAALPPAL